MIDEIGRWDGAREISLKIKLYVHVSRNKTTAARKKKMNNLNFIKMSIISEYSLFQFSQIVFPNSVW